MKRLLILYHSQGGGTGKLAQAVLEGAKEETEVDSRMVQATTADLEDLLNCDGLIIGTPENFGYMAGAMKDFFDRTFYPAQEYRLNLPYALFVGAGNDGSGAVRSVERIVSGYPMHKVLEPVVLKGEVGDEGLERCRELGLGMAAGLSCGIF